MGAKKITVVDLSQEEQQVKTSRKRAKNLAALKTTEQVEPTENEKAPDDQIILEPSGKELKLEKSDKKRSKDNKRKSKHRSARYSQLNSILEKGKAYTIEEALSLVKQTANTKFTGSVEAHLIVNQKGLRGMASLPHGTGKKRLVLAFGANKPQDGVIVGDDAVIKKIEERKLVPQKDFQIVVATPVFMSKLAKIAKILGPKGMMPSPKAGTVSENVENLLTELFKGQIEFKTEANAPLIHTTIGKTNFTESDLKENLLSLTNAIGQVKINQLTINCTMGPGIKVKL